MLSGFYYQLLSGFRILNGFLCYVRSGRNIHRRICFILLKSKESIKIFCKGTFVIYKHWYFVAVIRNI